MSTARPPHAHGRWNGSTLALFALLVFARGEARAASPSVAFFYGSPVPVVELREFDWVVVEPAHLDAAGLAELQGAGVLVFAYLSVGEAPPSSVDESWVLGPNAGWGTVVLDPCAAGWREHVLRRAEALWQEGYRGLFLDNLDSHLRIPRGAGAQRAATVALAELIASLHHRHPEVKLFFNRGFEILDEVGRLASGIAAESLVFGWDPSASRYVEVPEAEREWLARRLLTVKEQFGLPVVVIDYLPSSRRAEARDAARRIEAMGFVPWISTPALDALGVGSARAAPRRVLLLYDGAEGRSAARGALLRRASAPLESLGYAVEDVDVRRGLPDEPLVGRYAGIVTWFTDDDLPDALGYPSWLAQQIEDGIRVAILGRPGATFSTSLLAKLGLSGGKPDRPHVVRVTRRDRLIGAEAEPALRSRGLVRWHAVSSSLTVHLRLEDSSGEAIDPVVTAPWGGMALEPYLLEMGYQGRVRWIVDPLAFLESALALERAPVASGRGER